MTHTTGGHYLDTGDGPTSLDATVPEMPPPAREIAWAAYQGHQRGCSQCQRSVWRCADGNALWQAYIESTR